jgi:amino acid adenylation domain-containing protein
VQYADFARWQRRWLAGDVLESHMTYWRRQLANAPELLNLPTDHPRPPIETHRGGGRWFSLPESLGQSLQALGRRANTTLFCVLLTAFNVLLMRLSGQEDIVVGSPIANRTQTQTESLIGFFANTQVLRTDLSGNPTFLDLIGTVHRVLMEAAEHQDVPFEKIVQDLQPTRSLNHNPLFQVMLVLQNMPGTQDNIREYAEAWQRMQPSTDEPAAVSVSTSKFDLTLTLIETGAGLAGGIEYSAELFEPETIDRIINHLRVLMEHAVADPDRRIWQLPVMTSAAEARLRMLSHGVRSFVPRHATVAGLVAARAGKIPELPAIIATDRIIDYATLCKSANRLARRLARLGVASGDHVAISMPRGPEMLIAVLAILKAGAAYVPIDPAYPGARRSFMLSDSRAVLLVRQSGSGSPDPEDTTPVLELTAGDAVSPEEAEADFQVPLQADSPAYIIYTSGSTGKPKGVVMPHGAMTNLIRWQNDNTAVAGGRTLQFASLSFDVSFQEIFSTWTTGGALVVIDGATRADPTMLLEHLRAHQVHRLFLPYIALQQLAEAARMSASPLPPLREIITAGEQLRITPAVVRLFERLNGCSLRNQYGPTETHVATEYVLAGPPQSWPALPPIGAPIANVAVHILDRFGKAVPIGVVGEIHLSGACLASGYLDRSDQTAERFLSAPGTGAAPQRMYRTGDLGRRLGDGAIEFCGRSDHQIKIRGYRIEPGEIESALTENNDVADAAVVTVGASADTKRLVAFVVLNPSAKDANHIRDQLAMRLPEHLVPSAVVAVDKLPLTPSGKLDRERLMHAPVTNNGGQEVHEPPATPLEQMLAEHWAGLLGLAQVNVHDDFFRLGGHSLMATRIIARVYGELGLRVPVRSLFSAPTVRQFARAIVEQIADQVKAAQSEVLVTKLEESILRTAA